MVSLIVRNQLSAISFQPQCAPMAGSCGPLLILKKIVGSLLDFPMLLSGSVDWHEQ